MIEVTAIVLFMWSRVGIYGKLRKYWHLIGRAMLLIILWVHWRADLCAGVREYAFRPRMV
jgi:hypothetical protein